MNKPNPHLVKRLEGIRQVLLGHHAGGTSLPNAVKGSERESFVRNFLQQLFPPAFRFGSGAITDSAGEISGQVDIVIEYPFLPSFPMPGGSERLYLADSVAVVLEVKSDLSAQWNQVERSVQQLRAVKRRWKGTASLIGNGIRFTSPTESNVPYIAVGFAGYANIESVKKRLRDTPDYRRPDGVLVIDSGAFVGSRCEAHGALGLHGLVIDLAKYTLEVSGAGIDIAAYAGVQAD